MADSASSPLRRELVKGLLIALPLAVAQSLVLRWVGSFSDNPWGVAALLVPLLAAAWLLGRPLYQQRRLVLGGGSLAFFFVYCLLFSVAAGTEALNGRRVLLAGFERATPTNFLGLGWLGDWRYRVAPEADAARDLVVVTFPSFGGVETWKARRTHADLVALATRMGAKGVAFDFFFPLRRERRGSPGARDESSAVRRDRRRRRGGDPGLSRDRRRHGRGPARAAGPTGGAGSLRRGRPSRQSLRLPGVGRAFPHGAALSRGRRRASRAQLPGGRAAGPRRGRGRRRAACCSSSGRGRGRSSSRPR